MKAFGKVGTLVAGALALMGTAAADNKVAVGSGTWPGITWSPTGDPVTADTAAIGNGYSVEFIGPDTHSAGQIRIGSTDGGHTPFGTLTVSSGILQARGSGSTALQVGSSPNAVGILNVTGGTILTNSGNGGWLNAGSAANSRGTINLRSGRIAVNLHAALGSADGAVGEMTMSGGELSVVGQFMVGRRVNNVTAQGIFTQTGGKTIVGTLYVGASNDASQNITGSVRITGGEFTASTVSVGRTAATGSGAGRLTVGPDATVKGGTGAWTVSSTGELAFELGSTLVFNAVDLTAATGVNAIFFSEAGARIEINGTNLTFSESYEPVILISYLPGKGPDAVGQANVDFSYTGFADGFVPLLTWTDTGLQLAVSGTTIPESSTYAVWLASVVFGLAFMRRLDSRRRNSARW